MKNQHYDGWSIFAKDVHIADISFSGKIDGMCLLFTVTNENEERPLLEFSGNAWKQDLLTYKNRSTGAEVSGRNFAIVVEGNELSLRDFNPLSAEALGGRFTKLVRFFERHF